MVTIICGENSWAITKRLTSIIADFIAEHGELALEQQEGIDASLDGVREAMLSLPFLASKKMLVLRRPSENNEIAEKIEEVVALADDSAHLVIVEGLLDKRKSYYKTLRRLPGFEEPLALSGAGLLNWLVDEAKNNGGSLRPSDAQYLIDKVGQNQSLLSNEVHKLTQYNPEISRQTIDLLCEPTPESTIFDLLSAAFAGNHQRALILYEQQRMLRVEPHAILNMLVWQLHQIALAKTSRMRSSNELAKATGLSPYSARKSLQLADTHSLREIQTLSEELTDIDYRTKTSSYDIDEALKTLVASL